MQIIGQGGPTNDVFAELWGNIAAHYASNDKIIFGVYVLGMVCLMAVY